MDLIDKETLTDLHLVLFAGDSHCDLSSFVFVASDQCRCKDSEKMLCLKASHQLL